MEEEGGREGEREGKGGKEVMKGEDRVRNAGREDNMRQIKQMTSNLS